MNHLLSGLLPPLDVFALGWFFFCWFGYGWFAERNSDKLPALDTVIHKYRLLWGRELLRRDNRVADAALVAGLKGSVSFYANTSLYIVAGLMAVWGTLDKVIDVAEALPFAREVARELWEIKLVVLVGVYIFAYFKFTWSLRQFNILSILFGAAPDRHSTEEQQESYAQKMALVNRMAGDEFNRGLRAYYFGLGALAWFLQPGFFILVTSVVVAVLMRRDYASKLRNLLLSD